MSWCAAATTNKAFLQVLLERPEVAASEIGRFAADLPEPASQHVDLPGLVDELVKKTRSLDLTLDELRNLKRRADEVKVETSPEEPEGGVTEPPASSPEP